MKTIIKDSLILFIITLISGIALGFVYDITKEPIAEQNEKIEKAAYEKVFTDKDGNSLASDFSQIFQESEKEEDQDTEAIFAERLETDGYGSNAIDKVICALDTQGNTAGYVYMVTNKEGYGGDIVITVGILNDGTVNGISVLTINETPGLGMKANESGFLDQFAGKKVDSFKYTKTGKTADNEIDAISAATVTTNAMTNAVNSAISAFNYMAENDFELGGVTQ